MRKLMRWGLLGMLMGSAILYVAATAWTIRPSPAKEEGLPAGTEEAASAPDEPQPIDAGKQTADWQPLETIDLLRPAETSNPSQEEELPCAPGLDNAAAAGWVPAENQRCTDESDLLHWPPHGTVSQPRRAAAHAVKNAESELQPGSPEEQEQLPESVVDPKAIEQRLEQVLQSYLREVHGGRAGVDTLEFRPSDAKKGEFDRLPF